MSQRTKKQTPPLFLIVLLLGLTLFGCSNGESTGSEGGSGGDGGSAGIGGIGGTGGQGLSDRPLTLEVYSESELWTYLERTVAIDSNDVIYLTDGEQVYAVAERTDSVYLSTAEIEEVVGAGFVHIKSLDVGSDDRLYILNDPHGQPEAILASSGRGDVAVHSEDFELGNGIPHQIGVESPERILLVTLYDGLFALTDGNATEVYPESEFHGGTNCGSEDFMVDGTDYYYLPGCSGDDLYAGRSDGSSTGMLLEAAEVREPFERMGEPNAYAWGFQGLSRHPDGGIVANFVGALVHITADGSFTPIPTEPKLWDVPETAGFRNGVLTVDSNGQIYIMNWARSVIYRAGHQPPE